jgi:hypothetical protein
MSHCFFEENTNGILEIKGEGTNNFFSVLNCNNVSYCLSRNGNPLLELCDSSSDYKTGLVSLPNDDRSYLLTYFRPSPFYVAAMPVKNSNGEFSAVNQKYCGTQFVRCRTITYARTLFRPDTDYEVRVYYGWYSEKQIKVLSKKLEIKGESKDGSVIGMDDEGVFY